MSKFDWAEASTAFANISNLEPTEERLATVAWNLLTEPGDGIAGLLIDSLSASTALNCLIERQSAEQIRDLVVESGLSSSDPETIKQLDDQLGDGLQRWLPRLSYHDLVSQMGLQASVGGRLLFEGQDFWPSGLDDLGYHRPHVLWHRGAVENFGSLASSVAVVGSRACTSYGERITHDMVSALSVGGFTIVSGGAYGIDASAHRAALAMNTPTVAVMAGGLSQLYPRGNSELLGRIEREGLLVSEVSPSVTPSKWRFLQRNRLIAAVSQATLVIEAGYKSGARNTATHAKSLDRLVAAVPGSILSPSSAGCNLLIAEQVAQLTQGPSDFMQLLGNSTAAPASANADMSALETRVFDAVGFGSATLEQICTDAGLTSSEAQFAIGALKLSGLIHQSAGGYARVRA